MRSSKVMADDKAKIILFPQNRIVNKRTKELSEQRRKMGEKVAKEIKKQQTKKFVEGAVDDISMNLLKAFVDLAMKTNKPQFTKDLALLVDVMRGMIYRDFELPHPAQKLADKMVILNTNRSGTVSAKLNYAKVLDEEVRTNRPIPAEVKNELKDINDSSIQFDPDGDLND